MTAKNMTNLAVYHLFVLCKLWVVVDVIVVIVVVFIICVLAADVFIFMVVVVVVVKITNDVTIIHILQSHQILENPWFMEMICISTGNFYMFFVLKNLIM